jgi:hypothetical protein
VYQDVTLNTSEYNLPENQINIFPVPASGSLTVETNSKELTIEKIIIYDGRGSQVSNTKNHIEQSRLSLSLSGFENGIYFMEVMTDKGVVMRKFLVSK